MEELNSIIKEALERRPEVSAFHSNLWKLSVLKRQFAESKYHTLQSAEHEATQAS